MKVCLVTRELYDYGETYKYLSFAFSRMMYLFRMQTGWQKMTDLMKLKKVRGPFVDNMFILF